MTRRIYTKWIIGAALLLFIVATGCILWYQHTIAPYKQESEQTDKLLQQWEADKAKPTIAAETETTQVPADTTTPTAEKPTNIIGKETETHTDKTTQPVNIATSKQTNTEKVKVSPFGFGPYPKLPPDFPKDYWERSSTNKEAELLARVRVKLLEQGKNVIGTGMHKGLILPTIPNTIYVEWDEVGTERYVARMMGDPSVVNRIMTETQGRLPKEQDIPTNVTVINYLDGAIDPYQFLGLKE